MNGRAYEAASRHLPAYLLLRRCSIGLTLETSIGSAIVQTIGRAKSVAGIRWRILPHETAQPRRA